MTKLINNKIDNFVDQAYSRLEALDVDDNQELAEIERIEQEVYDELLEANYKELSKVIKDSDDIEQEAERLTELQLSWRTKPNESI
tara:strand:- start:385 stop:642 length:258 start_codon:yes stop_codon:yes gene_type:complete